MSPIELFECLLEFYGPRGWWPLVSRAGQDGRDEEGYLPGGTAPSDRGSAFEIAVGAVLTQNTAWAGAEQAVKRLYDADLLTPRKILSTRPEDLAVLIRSAGCYNVKARKLYELSTFFQDLPEEGPGFRIPARECLLSVWGIGPETADSILLYAFGIPGFVVDEYSRRIFRRLGMKVSLDSYDGLKASMEREILLDWTICAEYHALLVEHAKAFCRSSPACSACIARSFCEYRMSQ